MNFIINATPPYFGDCWIAATLTQILRDNGISAFLRASRIGELVDDNIPRVNDFVSHKRRLDGDSYTISVNCLNAKDVFNNFRLHGKSLEITRKCAPIKYAEIPEVDAVDVVMATGSPHIHKIWPYFAELQSRLDSLGITWFDLSKFAEGDFRRDWPTKLSNIFLNYVKKSKFYLGIDTGSTHYASKFLQNGRHLIIQAPRRSQSWNYFYQLELTSVPGAMDIKDVSVDMVLKKVLQGLSNFDTLVKTGQKQDQRQDWLTVRTTSCSKIYSFLPCSKILLGIKN